MSLTRKTLSAMEIPTEKIDEIINAHIETVNALKAETEKVQKEFDDFKEANKSVGELQLALDKANAELEKLKSTDWESKYSELKDEYDKYKSDTESKEVKAAKESAYRKLLSEAGVSSKRIDSIVKVSDSKINELEFDNDGNVKDTDKIIESVKTEWADFIPVISEKGADVSKPIQNNGGDVKPKSRAAELVAQYRIDHYGNPTKED